MSITACSGTLRSDKALLLLNLVLLQAVRETHLQHVIVILQEALQLLPDCDDARLKPLVPGLHLAHPL